MSAITAEVNLLFPSMDRAYRVRVTPRQLFFLDLFAERRMEPDGTASYILPVDTKRAMWRVSKGTMSSSAFA